MRIVDHIPDWSLHKHHQFPMNKFSKTIIENSMNDRLSHLDIQKTFAGRDTIVKDLILT